MAAENGAEMRAEKYADAERGQRTVGLIAPIVAAALFLAFIFLAWLVPVRAGDDSMAPAITSGDTVFFNRLYKFTASPDRGGIFAYTAEDGPHIGRVVALPGELVETSGGDLYINGVFLDESAYTAGGTAGETGLTVPAGMYLLMPDDRTGGAAGALVSAEKLTGRALIRTAPIGRTAFFG